MSDYRVDNRGAIPGTGLFPLASCAQTIIGAHQASYPICIVGGGSFLWGKARLGRNVDHSPPSRAEVKNEELYSSLP
jgi:hypothetical protein